MNRSNSSSSSGIGAVGLLGVLFVGLKLHSDIDWSWWYILAPFYLGPAVVLVGTLAAVMVCGVIALLQEP
jgi:hypothetical protein